MEDFELTLFDRVEMTKKLVEKAGGQSKVCVSFSGGKDSSVLSALLDLALPGNSIPRVFSDTGMEFQSVRRSVEEKAREDRRIIIVRPGKPIVKTLEEVGFPMKSKLHAHFLRVFQKNGYSLSVRKYMGIEEGYSPRFRCPRKLLGQFEPGAVPFKVSEHCCREFKKKPMLEAEKVLGRPVAITGERKEEGGRGLPTAGASSPRRTTRSCLPSIRAPRSSWTGWWRSSASRSRTFTERPTT